MNPPLQTTISTAPPRPGAPRAAWLLAGRTIDGWRTQPGTVAVVWLFPVLITLLFLGLFGGALTVPNGTSYVDLLLPGMLVVTVLFGLETTTLATAADSVRGVHDRLRSLPIPAVAIVAGRCLADLLASLVSLGFVAAAGLALGWRPQTSALAALAALLLLLMLRSAMLWIGLWVGHGARTLESVAWVQIVVWPIAFLSGVFVDPATMPSWLAPIAEYNPISTTATAVRDLLGAPNWSTTGQTGSPAWPSALLGPAVLTAIFLPLAANRFRRGSR